jgi:hypothetical protein
LEVEDSHEDTLGRLSLMAALEHAALVEEIDNGVAGCVVSVAAVAAVDGRIMASAPDPVAATRSMTVVAVKIGSKIEGHYRCPLCLDVPMVRGSH